MKRLPGLTAGGVLTVAASLLGLSVVPLVAEPVDLARGSQVIPGAAACPPDSEGYDLSGTPRNGYPNDPLFDRQWALDQIHAPAAWARGAKGQSSIIAVIDTGVDFNHPDLRGNLLPGVNLMESRDRCSRPQDTHGHGTTVAGVAAAVTNNGEGIAGVAPLAKIMPIRATSIEHPLPGEGPLTRGPIDLAVRYAADHGAHIVVLTAFTNVAPTDDPLDASDDEIAAAIAYAWTKGVVIVAPAVNASAPACAYPAAEELVICAAATDHEGNPAWYSNLPVKPDQLAFRAPGGFRTFVCQIDQGPDDRDVWTTALGGGNCGPGTPRGYITASGSSYSAPHVAGVAAILAGMGLTNQQIVDCFKKTSLNPTTGTRGAYDPVYGWGIVDADAATTYCPKK